jgi:hypothetical protein
VRRDGLTEALTITPGDGCNGGQTSDSFPPAEPIPTGIANGRYGAWADEKPDRLPCVR